MVTSTMPGTDRDRAPITPPAQLTLRLLLAGMVWLLVMQAAVERSLVPPIGIVQALLLAVPTVMVARRVRGGLVTATAVTGLILLAAVPFLIKDLSRPSDLVTFSWNLVALPLFAALPFVSLRAVRAQRRTPAQPAS